MRFGFIPPDARSRNRLWMMYHVVFVMLLAHFLLVYLKPGYFYDPQNVVRRSLGLSTLDAREAESRLIERDGRQWLPGGPNPSDHFDVTQFRLDPQNLRYGIGREHFPALIEPQFVSVEQADGWLSSEAKVLAVHLDDEVKVYPVELLIRHEVVNDVVGGVPIFAAYCILADLGAVYDRRLGEETLTFALSGYTYSESGVWDGRDAFVLWDRETESLWWPPIGKAVSGPLIDTPLKLLDRNNWAQTTWDHIRKRYPDALVLERGQDFERPSEWKRLKVSQGSTARTASEPSIAPRWGENPP